MTTNAWDRGNKCQYVAVTGHGRTRAGVVFSTLLDIIELTDPCHDGHYLCTKLLEVTDRLGIICAVISVTRDNASPNNTMLEEFEADVEECYTLSSGREKRFFCCGFNRVEGGVRCCAHVYNIAVQAGNLCLNY